MKIEHISYTAEMVDGLHQSVMLYKALLEQAKKETASDQEAYEIADHVFRNMMKVSE